MEDGRIIAVKALSLNKSQQGEREFLAEVKLITSIQHKNLVRLLGSCIDGPQRILIYEYMKNRSLDLFIYGWYPFSNFIIFLCYDMRWSRFESDGRHMILQVSNAKSLRERETIWIEDCVPCIVVGDKFVQMRI